MRWSEKQTDVLIEKKETMFSMVINQVGATWDSNITGSKVCKQKEDDESQVFWGMVCLIIIEGPKVKMTKKSEVSPGLPEFVSDDMANI